MWLVRYETHGSDGELELLREGWEPFAVGPAQSIKGYVYDPKRAVIWLRKQMNKAEMAAIDKAMADMEAAELRAEAEKLAQEEKENEAGSDNEGGEGTEETPTEDVGDDGGNQKSDAPEGHLTKATGPQGKDGKPAKK